jgi:hypothetical protein
MIINHLQNYFVSGFSCLYTQFYIQIRFIKIFYYNFDLVKSPRGMFKLHRARLIPYIEKTSL